MRRRTYRNYLPVLLGLIALVGCGKTGTPSTGPSGGAGRGAADPKLVKTIETKIAADQTLRGAAVRVQPQEQAILLDGTVKSIAQKDRAEQIVIEAQKAAGQTVGVQNNLLVKE